MADDGKSRYSEEERAARAAQFDEIVRSWAYETKDLGGGLTAIVRRANDQQVAMLNQYLKYHPEIREDYINGTHRSGDLGDGAGSNPDILNLPSPGVISIESNAAWEKIGRPEKEANGRRMELKSAPDPKHSDLSRQAVSDILRNVWWMHLGDKVFAPVDAGGALPDPAAGKARKINDRLNPPDAYDGRRNVAGGDGQEPYQRSVDGRAPYDRYFDEHPEALTYVNEGVSGSADTMEHQKQAQATGPVGSGGVAPGQHKGPQDRMPDAGMVLEQHPYDPYSAAKLRVTKGTGTSGAGGVNRRQ